MFSWQPEGTWLIELLYVYITCFLIVEDSQEWEATAEGQSFILRICGKEATVRTWVSVKNLSKKKNQKEAERSGKNPPGTQNLP